MLYILNITQHSDAELYIVKHSFVGLYVGFYIAVMTGVWEYTVGHYVARSYISTQRYI